MHGCIVPPQILAAFVLSGCMVAACDDPVIRRATAAPEAGYRSTIELRCD